MSASDLITVIGGSGILASIGAGFRFVWREVKKAQRQSEARFTHVETELDKCRNREVNGIRRLSVHLTVIELLWHDIRGLARGRETPAQKRAKKLLDDLKLDLPPDDPDLTALAHKLDDI